MSNVLQLRHSTPAPTPFHRPTIAARNAQAFAQGDRRRRWETAHALEQIAGAMRRGEATELEMQAAARLIALKGNR